MTKHKRLLCLFVVASCTCPSVYANTGCSGASMAIPVHVPPDVKAVSLSDLRFAAWDSLDASFLLENRASKDMAYLTIVLEYQMKAGNRSLAVVYEAAPDTKQPSDYLIPAQRVQPLPHPILPRQKQWISGSSPYTPPECPISAQLTMLDIHYVDHSSLTWGPSGWWTEPLLSDFPETLSIPDSDAWTSEQYFFLAKINRDGQLEEIEPIPPTPIVPSGTVAKNLKKLTFTPKLVDGKPDSAIEIFIVRFDRPAAWKAEKKDARTADEAPALKRPWATIQLDQPQDNPQHDWYFDFGGGWSYRTNRVYRAGSTHVSR